MSYFQKKARDLAHSLNVLKYGAPARRVEPDLMPRTPFHKADYKAFKDVYTPRFGRKKGRTRFVRKYVSPFKWRPGTRPHKY